MRKAVPPTKKPQKGHEVEESDGQKKDYVIKENDIKFKELG